MCVLFCLLLQMSAMQYAFEIPDVPATASYLEVIYGVCAHFKQLSALCVIFELLTYLLTYFGLDTKSHSTLVKSWLKDLLTSHSSQVFVVEPGFWFGQEIVLLAIQYEMLTNSAGPSVTICWRVKTLSVIIRNKNTEYCLEDQRSANGRLWKSNPRFCPASL